jgi:hypothetical protein
MRWTLYLFVLVEVTRLDTEAAQLTPGQPAPHIALAAACNAPLPPGTRQRGVGKRWETGTSRTE